MLLLIRNESNVHIPEVICDEKQPGRGQPTKVIDQEFLHKAMEPK
jgi:hypothetical protein